MNHSHMLTADEAAELLHLNVKRVQSLARAGTLPAARVGREWLVLRHELARRPGHAAGPPPTVPPPLTAPHPPRRTSAPRNCAPLKSAASPRRRS